MDNADNPLAPPPASVPGRDAQARPVRLEHYEVQGEIGRGGMAVVYRGVQPSLNRAVAIKILPPQFTGSPELLARFEREATIVAQLNHSNIVQVIDRGREGNTLFIVMEYVDGDGLDKLIPASGLPLPQVVDYAAQICDALEYAHANGIVHRDLKPSNILIDKRSGRAKLVDFGIAQLDTTGTGMATLTVGNAAIGTMNYMSPEQRRDSHAVDYRTDIFSFGVVLYEMLTGKLPIGHFKLPSLIRTDLPIGVDTIVSKCLAEAAQERYQNASEIAADLCRLTGRYPKYRQGGLSAWGRLSSRQRVHVLWGTVALVICLVAIGFAISRARQATAPAGQGVASPAAKARKTVRDAAEEAHIQEDARVQADFTRAQGLIGNRQYAEAINALDDLVRQHPLSALAPEAQFALARACLDMGEKEKARTEFAKVVRNYPDSARVPDARIAGCRIEWDAAPHHGMFRTAHSAEVQQRLVDELTEILILRPRCPQVPAVLKLIAEIAQDPELSNWKLAADSLFRLAEADPAAAGPEVIFRAAEIYDRRVKDKAAAKRAYGLLLKTFADAPQAKDAKARLDAIGDG
jgi:TolA-binding protein/tRNA A-37 threonylcarbamoyl transferase component Bud32